MSAPLIPSPLDYIGRRRFALYPAIRECSPNDWVLGPSTWAEVQIINAKTGQQLWIPRRLIGGVGESSEAELLVGLTKQLHYRSGVLEPHAKRVIEMPRGDSTQSRHVGSSGEHRGPADVIGIRLENLENSSMNRALITLGISALVVSLLASLIFFGINACANMFNGRFGRLSQSSRLFVSQPSPAIVASRSTVSG